MDLAGASLLQESMAHLNQMHEPPQLVSLYAEEQRLQFEPLLDLSSALSSPFTITDWCCPIMSVCLPLHLWARPRDTWAPPLGGVTPPWPGVTTPPLVSWLRSLAADCEVQILITSQSVANHPAANWRLLPDEATSFVKNRDEIQETMRYSLIILKWTGAFSCLVPPLLLLQSKPPARGWGRRCNRSPAAGSRSWTASCPVAASGAVSSALRRPNWRPPHAHAPGLRARIDTWLLHASSSSSPPCWGRARAWSHTAYAGYPAAYHRASGGQAGQGWAS